jgi:hypothetical protein
VFQNLRFQLVNYQAQYQDLSNAIRTVAADRDNALETLKTFTINSTAIQALTAEQLMTNKEKVDAATCVYHHEVLRRYKTTTTTTTTATEPKHWAVATCVVCRDEEAPPNMCLGCGHVLCTECAPKVTECPFCRQPVTSITQLYNVFHT